jgi:hypothetical protein
VPSPLESEKLADDLEFEWLLCLARTLQTARRFRPAEVGETRRPGGLPRINNHDLFFEAQTGRAPKVVRQHRAVFDIAY